MPNFKLDCRLYIFNLIITESSKSILYVKLKSSEEVASWLDETLEKIGFRPTIENVRNYVGWGEVKESILPDSIIKQCIIAVMNVNNNSILNFKKAIYRHYFNYNL